MAPVKRGADSNAPTTNTSRHSTDDRASKRQRKSDVSNKSSKAKSDKSTEEKPPKTSKPVQASVLKEEEKLFPRGGASVLTPLEHKQIQIKATQDVLFEQAGGKKRTTGEEDSDIEAPVRNQSTPLKSKKRRKSKGRKDGAALEKEERRIKIEGLSYKRIVPGTMVLGQVTQITSRDLSLALPNNLTGYIPLTAISDQLTSRVEKLLADDEAKGEVDNEDEEDQDEDIVLDNIFSVGQYLRAYVTSTTDDVGTKGASKAKKRIELSINPKLANSGISKSDVVVNSMVQASVVSAEDHGLVMDLGLEDGAVKGFMSSREVGHNVDHAKVEEGAVFLCLVTGLSSNGKIVKLSTDHQKVGNVKKTNFLTDAPTVDAFLPGTAVEMLVTEVSSSGLAGQIMGMLDATADLIHSGAGESSKDITSAHKVGEKIKARVICTFPDIEPRRLGVSVLDHVLSLSSHASRQGKDSADPLRKLPLSSFVEEARVTKVEAGRGVFMDVGVKGVLGFAHISRLSDSKVEMLSSDTGPYKVESTHRARVVGYNPMDGLYLVSLEKKILDQPFLRFEDVRVGQVVSGKVERLIVNAKGVGGVLINLAEGISGLVPEMHMADVHLQHPEKKFREGMSVKARVLSTDVDKRQMRLTLKKSLVNSDADVWLDYKQISPGDQAPGTLVNILQNGAVVQFYGNVRAFLPVSEMSEAYILDPRQHFRIGQVVNVRVLDIDSQEGKMTVSCKDPTTASSSQRTALNDLVVGSVVNGTVTEKSTDSITLELEGSGLKAVLRVGQLTDGSGKKGHSMHNKIRVGQKMQDLLVLEKLEKTSLAVLTNKPSLLKAAKAGTLLTRFEEATEGKEVSGFVRNITLDGVFIQFAGGLVGLMLRSQIAEDMVKIPDFGLRKDQSLTLRVLAVDPTQKRFLLTMRTPKEEPKNGKAASASHPVTVGEALANPVDGELKSMEDFAFGKLTKARITAVKDTQLNVQLADNVQGRIDVSEAFNDWEDIKDRKHPLQKFKAKQVIPVRVLGIHDARNHRFLPITHRTGRVPVFELSAKTKSHLQSESDVLTMNKLEVGSSWIAFVNNIGDSCVWVNLSPNVRGRVDFMDLAEDVSLLSDVAQNFPVGSALRVRVKKVDASANRLDLTATNTVSSKPLTLQSLTKGMVLPGRVTKVTERSVIVQLSSSVSGPVPLTELADDYDQARPALHSKNDIVRVCVLDVDAPNKKIMLSMRPSKVLSSSLPVKDPQIFSIRQLKVNDVVRGFVKNVADKGVFVSLGPNVTAFVRISDLSDSFIKEWQTAFQVDQLVKGKILAVDPEINHVQISLKASIIDKDYVPPLTFDDLKPGQVVTGKIRKVEDFGVFIVVDNSNNVSGLCHRSEIADQKVEDVKKLYGEGDTVKAMVLKVDKEKRRVNFGLKVSYFQDSADASDVSDEEEEAGGVELDDADTEGDEEMQDGGVDLEDVKSIGSDDIDGRGSENEMGVDETPPIKSVTGLSTGGFDWSGTSFGRDEVGAEQSEAEDEDNTKKKKRRKPEIQVDKTGDLDKFGPQSVADFERQLLGQPNSSSLWIQYMAFQLQLNEVDKARDIAERALKTINIREEEEKMNVWIALLNLENTFGSDDSLEEAFKRACQYNDAEEMHERLASIYIDSGKHDKADALFQTMTKNKTITANPSFWLNYATFLMTTLSTPARARALLQRATQSVPAQQHRLLTAKFGALEFQSPNGDPERGRTIFEGLLSTFPKKWDLWDMFVDLEKARGEKENVRRLFERMAGMRMKSRRAKFVFKKWLEWEEENGEGKDVERVKARAAEYVEGLKKGEDEGKE